MDKGVFLFCLEDKQSLRENMIEFLTRRGFVVSSAGSIAEADKILCGGIRLDVVLLDNHLEGDTQSGAEYGRALRYRWLGEDAPEFLIYSGERDMGYVRQGIDLVMDYFSKAEYGLGELVVPLRVAALRKAVRWERRPGKLSVLRRIAAEAVHRDAAVAAFARDVLFPALLRALANPFCLVFTDLDGSSRIGHDSLEQDPIYDALALVAQPEPREWDGSIPDFPERGGPSQVLELYRRGPCVLCLAIGQGPAGDRIANDANSLAKAVQKYLVPVLYSALESLVEIMRGMHDAYVAGFTRGNTLWLPHLKTLRECLKVGDPSAMSLLESWIESAAWRAGEGQALLADDGPSKHGLQLAAESEQGVSLFELARTLWADLKGDSQFLILRGDDPGLMQQKVLWLLLRRFFKWTHQLASLLHEVPRACMEVVCTPVRLQVHLTAVGCAAARLDGELLMDAGGENHFFESRERVRRMGGYFQFVTEVQDVCVRISLPVTDPNAAACGVRA